MFNQPRKTKHTVKFSRLHKRLQHVYRACRTMPSRQTWLQCALLYSVFVGVAIPLGKTFNLLRFEQAADPWQTWLVLPLVLFVIPSLLEELFFRGMLLPHTQERVSLSAWFGYVLISLLGFVLWHPLNGLTFSPAVGSIFSQPVFLVLATLFGVVVTGAYLISESLWPPILMHWLTIVGWVLFLGGRGLVRGTLGI